MVLRVSLARSPLISYYELNELLKIMSVPLFKSVEIVVILLHIMRNMKKNGIEDLISILMSLTVKRKER